MKKFFHSKKILAVLLSGVIATSAIGVLSVAGGHSLPWKSEASGVNQILERDGYLEGIWYPWLAGFLGNSLTSNETMVKYVGTSWNKVGIDEYGEGNLYKDIYNLKSLGFNIMGYEGSPYGEGVVFDDNGDVLGIKEEYLANVRRLLDICRRAEMPVLWTVCFHSSTVPEYYGMDSWNIISQMYCNPEVTEHYVERFVTPLCAVLKEYSDVVVLVSSTSEPENEINDDRVGNHYESREVYGVTKDAMFHFIARVNETLAKEIPDIARTCESNGNDLAAYSEMDLDFIGKNMYGSSASSMPVESYKSTAPMLVTEFGIGDGGSVADEVFSIKQINFRESFIQNGYRGWFMWCWQPNTYGTVFSLLGANAKSKTDFRGMAYSMHFFVEDYRSEYRKEEVVIDTPVMFCNSGSGLVEWIGTRQGSSIDLLRSLDGGQTWIKLLDNVASSDYESGYKGSYMDETLPKSGKVMYKVVARDGDDVAESKPSNEADILGPAVNLVKNGDFETGDLTDWAVFGSDVKVQVKQMETDGHDAGNHVLDIAFGTKEWQGVHQDGLDVKPNTNYKLTFKYKKADDCTAQSMYCYMRTLDANGNGTGLGDIYDGQPVAHFLNKGSKTEWTEAELTFRTNAGAKLGIDFRVLSGAHFYIDDISLTEVR